MSLDQITDVNLQFIFIILFLFTTFKQGFYVEFRCSGNSNELKGRFVKAKFNTEEGQLEWDRGFALPMAQCKKQNKLYISSVGARCWLYTVPCCTWGQNGFLRPFRAKSVTFQKAGYCIDKCIYEVGFTRNSAHIDVKFFVWMIENWFNPFEVLVPALNE